MKKKSKNYVTAIAFVVGIAFFVVLITIAIGLAK